ERMIRRTAGAPAKRVSAAQAAALVKPGMWVDYAVALCQPDAFDTALAARRDELSDVKVRTCLSMRPRAFMECDPQGEAFHAFSWHFSGYDRRQHDVGRCNYIPLTLAEVPDHYR